MYKIFMRETIEEVVDELNKRRIDTSNIIHIHKEESNKYFMVLYYEQPLES